MTFLKRRFSGLKRNLKTASLFFNATLILCAITPGVFAASPKPEKESSEIYVQQIGPSGGKEEELDIGNVYKNIPPNKSLRTVTQFKVIDDFNSGELKNLLGGGWFVNEGEEKKIRLDLKKEDGRGVRSGSSLWARYNLRDKDQTAFRTSLEKLDISAARYLVFKCKVSSAKSFEGRIRVSLSDWAGRTVEKDVTESCLESANWNEAILPLSTFAGVDFDQLDSLSFKVLARAGNMAGKIGLDEVAFYGRHEVGFESIEDNLVGFPKTVLDESRRKELLGTRKDKKFLLGIAKDTWRYFENARDKKTHLVVDHLKTGDFPLAAAYTSPTNIAMDLMGTVAAREMEIITPQEAEKSVQSVLRSVKKMKTWKGFFYNYYETTQLGVSRQFISSIDNGWLAIALVVVRQAFQGEIAKDATEILDKFHFQEFLDPENNHLVIGYDIERQSFTPYHYGMLATEARAMSLYGIGKGDLPKEQWWYLYRTAPDAWEWQTQKPQGKMVEHDRVSYFQGYYKDGSTKFVPSWGGSLFEFLMPTIVINEKKFASKNLGLNDKIATELHRDYALKEKKYPVWGISPAATASGRRWQYGEYGIKKLGVKGYSDRGVITPHVSFLALETLPKDAIKNIRAFLNFNIYGEYGFYDSIIFPSERVNPQYLALDQGMILIPIANYLKNGVIQEYFHKDPVGKKAKEMLEEERFF
jgi:hypothetical protein